MPPRARPTQHGRLATLAPELLERIVTALADQVAFDARQARRASLGATAGVYDDVIALHANLNPLKLCKALDSAVERLLDDSIAVHSARHMRTVAGRMRRGKSIKRRPIRRLGVSMPDTNGADAAAGELIGECPGLMVVQLRYAGQQSIGISVKSALTTRRGIQHLMIESDAVVTLNHDLNRLIAYWPSCRILQIDAKVAIGWSHGWTPVQTLRNRLHLQNLALGIQHRDEVGAIMRRLCRWASAELRTLHIRLQAGAPASFFSALPTLAKELTHASVHVSGRRASARDRPEDVSPNLTPFVRAAPQLSSLEIQSTLLANEVATILKEVAATSISALVVNVAIGAPEKRRLPRANATWTAPKFGRLKELRIRYGHSKHEMWNKDTPDLAALVEPFAAKGVVVRLEPKS